MNNMRKAAAIRNFGNDFNPEIDKEEIIAKILSTEQEKPYTREEAEEIYAALLALQGEPKPEDSKANSGTDSKEDSKPEDKTADKTEDKKPEDGAREGETTLQWAQRITREDEARKKTANLTPVDQLARGLIRFTQYQIEYVTRRARTAAGGAVEIREGFKKKGELIRVSEMEQRHADIENLQVANTMRYWFKDNEPDYIKLELEEVNEPASNV